MVDELRLGHRRRVVDEEGVPVGEVGDVLDRRGRGDQRQAELALEPLADDLHVEQTEESAAEPKTECRARLRLVGHARVVQLELLERVAQVRELVAVDRVKPAEHHRLRVLVALERRRRRPGDLGDRLTDACLGHVLDPGDEVADFARAEGVDLNRRRRTDSQLLDVVGRPGL